MSTISGSNGNDILTGTTSADTISGGNGNDTISGGDGSDTLAGGNGQDNLDGGGGDDTLSGGNGNDLLDGGAGSDTVRGDDGNDRLIYVVLDNLNATNFYDGGNGTDTLVLSLTQAQLDEMNTTTVFSDFAAAAGSSAIFDFSVYGFSFPMNLTATRMERIEFNIVPSGTAPLFTPGNDTVDFNTVVAGTYQEGTQYAALGGDDHVTLAADEAAANNAGYVVGTPFDAGAGNDVVIGGALNDHIIGGSGDDILTGKAGADRLEGGTGNDRASYITSAIALTVSLANPLENTGDALGDTYAGIEGLEGTNFDDILTGDGASNFLYGGLGADTLDGGGGSDSAHYVTAAAGLTVSLADPSLNTGDAAGDTYISIENLAGSHFADHLIGDNNNNFLRGQLGADTLDGGLGNDTADYFGYLGSTLGVTADLGNPANNTNEAAGDVYVSIENLRGSRFDDILRGDAGSNLLDGQAGADTLDGGDGFDFAWYNTNSTGTGVTASLANPGINTGDAVGDTYISIEGLVGSFANDHLIGNNNNNILRGSGGNDVLTGGGGTDIARFFGLRSAYTVTPGMGNLTVSGPDGIDTVSQVELLEFDNLFVLTNAAAVTDLSGMFLAAGKPIFGGDADNALLVTTTMNNRLIDLGNGTDTITLNEFGSPEYFLNLNNVEFLNSNGGIETVNLLSAANNLTVDLGTGTDTLNLDNATNVLTVFNVFNLNGGGGDDTVTFVAAPDVVNQSINLGVGTDVLNLAGADTDLSLFISGSDVTVNDLTDGGDLQLQLLNVQLGTTFDFGAGNDTLSLWGDGIGFNDLSVLNVETVLGTSDTDGINILGNTGGTTTVTGGWSGDVISASADVDQFRFVTVQDSYTDGINRDVIFDVDAASDTFLFDGMLGAGGFISQIEFIGTAAFTGGNDVSEAHLAGDILQIDVDGDGFIGANDMEIELVNLTGELTNTNFLVT